MKKLAFIIFSLVVITAMATPSFALMGQKPQAIPAPVIRGVGDLPSADGTKKCDPATAGWTISPRCTEYPEYYVCVAINECDGSQKAVRIPKSNLPGRGGGGLAQ